MRVWELREGRSREDADYRMGMRHKTEEEAYECGFEDGYEKAMEEISGHRSSYRSSYRGRR